MIPIRVAQLHGFLLQKNLGDIHIDMYFYSDYVHNYILGPEMAVPLISLSQYTYPTRIVFSDGTFGQQGLYDILDWMISNSDEGYFMYLESIQITRHRLNHFSSINGNKEDDIIDQIHTICQDTEHFPALKELNFDNNAFHEYESGNSFQRTLRNACLNTRTSDYPRVVVSAKDYDNGSADASVVYICPAIDPQGNALNHYDSNSLDENSQCKNTWHWDLFGTNRDIVNGGPYPPMNNMGCRPID